MARIFISYRRSTSLYSANLLYRLCADTFGRQYVFRDTEAIHIGDRISELIFKELSTCEVFLPIISPKWHEVADNNGLRLNNPEDWVRQEIVTILHRNDKYPSSDKKPVLVIPVLEAGASIPNANDLPNELKPLLDYKVFTFIDENSTLDLIIPLIEQHLGSPPMGNFGIRVLTQHPDMSRRDQYCFRYVRSIKDLEPFVTLSDTEEVIAGANPELSGKSRLELYNKWCQWTASKEDIPWDDSSNSVKSFMSLYHKKLDGTWEAIAVSIVLPLSNKGSQHLRLRCKTNDKLLWEKRNASTLEAGDLTRGVCKRLLLDTWIVKRCPLEPSKTPRRWEHYNWGTGLILRHIAEFWNPDLMKDFTFLCEPDNPRIAIILNDLGFNKEIRNAISGDIFVLKFPLDSDKYTTQDKENLDSICNNISSLHQIPIID